MSETPASAFPPRRYLAPVEGFEPSTARLTADCATGCATRVCRFKRGIFGESGKNQFQEDFPEGPMQNQRPPKLSGSQCFEVRSLRIEAESLRIEAESLCFEAGSFHLKDRSFRLEVIYRLDDFDHVNRFCDDIDDVFQRLVGHWSFIQRGLGN